MENKKLAFVIGSLSSGGAERVISNLSNELVNRFDILIITFTKSKPFYPLDERIKVMACRDTNDIPTSMFQSLKLNYLLVRNVYSIFKKEKVDIAIGFITSANIITTIAAKLYKIPCVISERNNPLVEEVPRFWAILRTWVYPMCDALVLQTNGIKNIYKKKLKAHKITILPNPLSTELAEKRDVSVEKEKLILTVGRLDINKCHEDLIKAYKALNIKDWKVKIIGDGNRKQELLALIDTYDLSNNIKIISKVKDMERYYNRASIFVLTSRTEGFPNALLEAMYFGVPSISYNCNFGPSDLINDGIDGFLTSIHDVEALKEKLLVLMTDKELRAKFSLKAKASTERFKSEFVVSKWENLIKDLIHN
ncbi:glycosyltransferase family 4 protein [Winogradskyella sp.]|uniref:glycosyltransferase family 4 protein n=1 Tax=Winogradskyella sp. TaxID=1883156 RepID=UPI003BAB50D0